MPFSKYKPNYRGEILDRQGNVECLKQVKN